MSITTARKSELVKEYGANNNDTGSTDVQVAILTERINNLTGHMKTHPQDVHSRKGLLAMVGQRRSLLDYIKKREPKRYAALIDKLKLRK